MTHRRAVVRLSIELLEQLLGIERPMKIVKVLNPISSDDVALLVYDPNLPETEEAHKYPSAVIIKNYSREETRLELC